MTNNYFVVARTQFFFFDDATEATTAVAFERAAVARGSHQKLANDLHGAGSGRARRVPIAVWRTPRAPGLWDAVLQVGQAPERPIVEAA